MDRVKRGEVARVYTGTLEFLKSIVSYNPDTGEFTTNLPYNIRPSISRATGYNMVKLPVTPEVIGKGRQKTEYYRVDHLAWFMLLGHWPEGQIEHLNGLRPDDSIENLIHLDTENRRWWYGPQPGTSFRYLVEVEGSRNSNTPQVDIYDAGDHALIRPRPSDGWITNIKPGKLLSVDEDEDIGIGEFGVDWT